MKPQPDNCWEVLHTLSGAIWRLQEYGYVTFDCEDDERGQMEHWIALMNQAINDSRDMASKINEINLK